MLCLSLLYNSGNQLYVYIYSLPLGPPTTLTPSPRSSQSTELSSLRYTQLPTSYFTHGVCVSATVNSPHSLVPFHPMSTSLFFTSASKNAYFQKIFLLYSFSSYQEKEVQYFSGALWWDILILLPKKLKIMPAYSKGFKN